MFQSQPSLFLMSERVNMSFQDGISHSSDPARHFLCLLVLVRGVDTEGPKPLDVLCLAVASGV